MCFDIIFSLKHKASWTLYQLMIPLSRESRIANGDGRMNIIEPCFWVLFVRTMISAHEHDDFVWPGCWADTLGPLLLTHLYSKNFHNSSDICPMGFIYILFKFVKSLIRHLGLAIANVWRVQWFSWTLLKWIITNLSMPLILISYYIHHFKLQ